MASFRNSAAFHRTVQVYVDEAHLHGWELTDEAAADLLGEWVTEAASRLGVQPMTVLRSYVNEDALRQRVREAMVRVTELGGTGRDDEAPVGVPVALLSQLIPDIAHAGRFAATHRDRIPHADLHNVVADALSAIGAALRQGDGRSIPVPGYHLRLARRALLVVIAGIKDGWVIEDLDTTDVDPVELTNAIAESMRSSAAAIEELLPRFPPPRAV